VLVASICYRCAVGGRNRVLLVDDSALALNVTADVLRTAGYDVRASTEVHSLRELLGEWLPDVILTDVNMPSMSGPELCRALKSTYETAHVPVVLFSALTARELEVLARDCEADGYLTKGDLDELPGALAHLIATALF
jgi:CheY-like chemotaxis protein